jgi:diguanylate cyclase (GGDEF)-like protein/PAS domain S-box-containing protein
MLRRLQYWIGSLKLRLALASFGLIAASVALTVVFVLHDMERRSQRAVLDAESANAERYAALLSSRLVALQTSLRSASTQLPAAHATDTAALVRFFEDQVVLRGIFDSVFVLAPNGHLVVNTDAAGVHLAREYSNPDASDRRYYKLTVQRRRPVISEPIVGRDSHEPQLVLTMPVFDRAGALVAILGGGLSLKTHALLSDVTRPSGDAHDPVVTIVADATGRIVSHPDPGWVFQDARREPRFRAAIAHWREQGEPIDPQGAAWRLGDAVVASAGVPDAEWVVLRSAPAELLLGGPGAGRLQATWIGAGVAVLGGLIILLTLHGLLEPLRLLERRALRLLDDDLEVQEGWPSADGELGELARVFRHVMHQRAEMQRTGDELFGKMRAVLANAPVGIAFTRLGQFELVSAQCERLFGYAAGAMTNRPSRMICISDDTHRAFAAKAAAVFAEGAHVDEEKQLQRADGTRFWARLQGAPVHADVHDAGTIWIITDVTDIRNHRERLSWSATHDQLTGLVNRWEFERRLAEQLQDRRANECSCALFIDLDRFKAVNDSAGHAAGDEVLRAIGAILAARARSEDTVARVGGDEFAVLLRTCDRAAAARIAHELCERIQGFELARDGAVLSVGASIGLVEIDDRFDSIADVMAAADAACYEAKRAGRNAVRTWRDAVRERLAPGDADTEA